MKSNVETGSARSLFSRFLKPYWKAILVIVILNMTVGFLTSLRPLVLAPALGVFIENKAAPATSFNDISLDNLGPTLVEVFSLDSGDALNIGIFVAVLFVIFTILIAALSMISQALVISRRTAVLRDIIIALHKHLLSLSLSYFHERRAGDLVSRVHNDVTMTSGHLDSNTRGILQSLSEIMITMIILFHTDALLAVAILSLGMVHILVSKGLGTTFRSRAKEMTDKLGTLSASLMEGLKKDLYG
jgi:ABC-type multidrug transport system fused ATPase/permease subunit